MLGQDANGQLLTISLIGHEAEDGRIYVNSPDLEGFHFVLEAGEDPMEAMGPTLTEFIHLYLRAEIKSLTPADKPKRYRRKQLDLPNHHHRHDYTMVAQVA